MRALTMLLCLSLAACAATPPAGDPIGASSDAAAGAGQASASAAPTGESERVTQARVECWAKVEQQKGLRSIDSRIAFVDKCVAAALKP
jgi:hypothetical protein